MNIVVYSVLECHLVLQLLGEGQLLLVHLDCLLHVAELDQDVSHVGECSELCLVVLHQMGNS